DLPTEEQVDLRRAAAGDGPKVVEALHRVDGVLNRPGHHDHHLVDREHAVIGGNDDARKIRIRENSYRNSERQIHAHGDQRQDDKDDRLAVAVGPVRSFGPSGGGWECREFAHFAFGFASSFFWSVPPFSSGSSSTSLTVVSITFTLALS